MPANMRRFHFALPLLLLSLLLLPLFASGQSSRCLRSCVGDGIAGERMASCQGCDWYVQCGSTTSTALQCPSGQLFSVVEFECKSQARATCGRDPAGGTLQPSSSFTPSTKDVVLEPGQATNSESSGFLESLWTWITNFIGGFIDGVSPVNQASTVPPGTAGTVAPNPTNSNGGILAAIFDFIGGFLDALFGGGDSGTSSTPGTTPAPLPTTLRTILTQRTTWPTPRTSQIPTLACVQSCQQVQPLAYSVHALCGRCSYFLECSYGVTYVRRCAPYTYFRPASGQCMADVSVCLTQGFMAEDPVKTEGQ